MIEILSPAEVEAARPAGRFVANTLRTLRRRASPGTDLLQIDAWAAELIEEAGAVSCYVDYAPSFGSGPFGHVICTSVNDAVLHGLPRAYTLQAGDLLSLDFAVSVDGWVCDSAVSFVVGEPFTAADPHDTAMIEATRSALADGIAAAQPGGTVGDISHAIGSSLRRSGYAINTQFGDTASAPRCTRGRTSPMTVRPGRALDSSRGCCWRSSPG